jgi:hypothetical protein
MEFVHENGRYVRILFGLVQNILQDNMNMCWITAKFMPHLLGEEQKDNCVIMCWIFLVPCDFFLFPKLKMALKGRFNDVTMIQAKSWDTLQTVA